MFGVRISVILFGVCAVCTVFAMCVPTLLSRFMRMPMFFMTAMPMRAMFSVLMRVSGLCRVCGVRLTVAASVSAVLPMLVGVPVIV